MEVLKDNSFAGRRVFHALLSVALNVFSSFEEKEVEEYYNFCIRERDKMLADPIFAKKVESDKGWKKRSDDKINQMVMNFKDHQLKMYNIINAEVAKSYVTPEEGKRTGEMAHAMELMFTELVKAKNKSEILTVAKLYNEGNFDSVFAKKEEPKKEPDNENPLTT